MLQISVNDKVDYSIEKTAGGWLVNGEAADWHLQHQPNGLISILHKGRSYTATVEKLDAKTKELVLNVDGRRMRIAVQEPIDQLLHSMGMDLKSMQKAEPVKAPMPGMVLRVLVEPGQQIAKGDPLLVLEAMKMENVLKAGGPATVKAVRATERTAVEKGAVLIELE